MDMAANKDDYLILLVKTIQRQIDRVEQKTDVQTSKLDTIQERQENSQQQIDTNTDDIKKLQLVQGKRLNLPSEKILYFIVVTLFIVAIIVAKIMGYDAGGLIP